MLPTEQPSSQNKTSDIKATLLSIISQDKRLFVGIAITVWLWMAVYCLTAYQPKYASQSLVQIKDSVVTSRYVVPDQNYALQTTTSSAANPVLNTMGLLKSKTVSDALWTFLKTAHPEELKRLGIKTQADWDAFFGNGKGFIKAKNEPGTDLIQVKFTWSNSKLSQEGLNTVLAAFQEASLDINRAEQRNRSQYLEDQVQQVEAKLKEVRRKKSEYKSTMKIASISRQSEVLAASGIDMATRLSEVEAKAKGKEAEYLRFEKMLNMSPEKALTASAIGMNSTLAKLQDEYYQLSQTDALLKTTLTEKNPKLKEVRAKMTQAESNIKAELARTLGQNYASKDSVAVADSTRGTIISQMVAARAESIRLQTEAAVLQERMGAIDQQIQALPNLEEELANIEEEERSLSNALYTLRQKELEARMKQAETLSNVFIIDSPSLPNQAGFPNQVHLIVLGLLLGIVAGAVGVMMKQQQFWSNLLPLSFEIEKYTPKPTTERWNEEPLVLKKILESIEDDNAAQYLDVLFPQTPEQSSISRRRLEEELRLRRLKERLYKTLLQQKAQEYMAEPDMSSRKRILRGLFQ